MGRAIRTLWARELRSALRERSLVIYSLLLPLTMYPTMIWVMLTGLSFVEGQRDEQRTPVAVLAQDGADADAIIAALELHEGIVLEQPAEARPEEVADGTLGALLVVHPAADAPETLAPDLALTLYYDGSKDLSRDARDRLEEALAEHRRQWLQDEAIARGIDSDAWQMFELKSTNIASEEAMGGLLLGAIAPATMLVMIAIGSMYPAIDTIPGERERSTWETSLTLGVPRRTLVIAKYLYVATMGAVSGLLNLVGITAAAAVLIRSKGLGKGELEVSVPMPAIPVIVLGTLVLALLVAALCLMLVPLARTYKEGQALASPVLLVVLFPAMAAGMPIDTVELGVAAIPIANVMMTFKMALAGHFPADFIALAFASTLATVALLLWLATRFIDNETLMLGEFEGSPVKVLQRWWKGRK